MGSYGLVRIRTSIRICRVRALMTALNLPTGLAGMMESLYICLLKPGLHIQVHAFKGQQIMKKKVDFLVIGSGLAGLSFAMKVAEHGKVCIISKTSLEQTNTRYAQGGIEARWNRYKENQRRLVEGMASLGFRCLPPKHLQSPIIMSFLYSEDAEFSFASFYGELKARGFVIYPGKVSTHDTFRIGNIGDIEPEDIDCHIDAVSKSCYWNSRKVMKNSL